MKYNLDSVLPINAFQPRGRSPFVYGMTLEGGPGNVVSDIGNFISDTAQGASDALASIDPGPAVGDALASIDPGPAIGDAGAAIDKGVNDVIPGGWLTVGTVALMVVAPYLAPALGAELAAGEVAAEWTAAEMAKDAAIAAAKNAAINATGQLITTGSINPDQVAKAGITGGVTGGLGSTLGAYGANPAVAGGVSGTVGGALNAAMNNRDIGMGALTGGVGGTVGGATSMVSKDLGLDPYSAGALRGATSGMTSAALNNKSVGTGALAGGIVGGATAAGTQAGNYIQNQISDDPAKGNSLLGQVLGGAAGAEAKDLLNPVSNIPRTTLAGAPRTTQPTGVLGNLPSSTVASSPAQATGFMPTMSPTGTPIYGNENSSSTLASATGMPTIAGVTNNRADVSLPGGASGVPFASSPNANTGYTSNLYPSSGLNANGMPAPLQSGVLTSNAVPESQDYASEIRDLTQLYPQLASIDSRIVNSLVSSPVTMKEGGFVKMASGGSPQYEAAQQLLGIPVVKESQSMQAAYGNPTGSHRRPLDRTHFINGQKDGGEQHIPEFVTGTTGHYVKGKGDGQSDDIPAMLADGEYVFDADAVAQLGNGSSDAGAQLLDHFRESLREHKRSASSDKIPPKASPLAYMKEALKRHKG